MRFRPKPNGPSCLELNPTATTRPSGAATTSHNHPPTNPGSREPKHVRVRFDLGPRLSVRRRPYRTQIRTATADSDESRAANGNTARESPLPYRRHSPALPVLRCPHEHRPGYEVSTNHDEAASVSHYVNGGLIPRRIEIRRTPPRHTVERRPDHGISSIIRIILLARERNVRGRRRPAVQTRPQRHAARSSPTRIRRTPPHHAERATTAHPQPPHHRRP